MRCHYTYTEEGEKVLIPCCAGTAFNGDIRYCTCHSEIKAYDRFEKDEFNRILSEKDAQIRELKHEVAYYNRQLKKVLEKRLKRKIR